MNKNQISKIKNQSFKTKINDIFRFLYLIFSLFFGFLFFAVNNVKASDFITDYQIEYFLTENKQSLLSHVNFQISITNQRSDLYIAKFSITYPKTFVIHNIKATDDKGEVVTQVVDEETKTKIIMDFNSPVIGKGSVNNLYLNFDQENLFKINGNIWEVILPTIDKKERGNYKIIVNLPDNQDKKISLAKPKPNQIIGRKIIWENPQTKTIYAVFGDRQFYQTELVYNLKNPKIIPVRTEIAFPPDTLYQKVYIESINPFPEKTFIDEDGNFMGEYVLAPREVKKVVFNGLIEVLAQPRLDVLPVIQNQFINQKKYLLSSQKYWNIDDIDNLEQIKSLKSIHDIYSYTVGNLKYNYEKVIKKNERLGALKVLRNPNEAVCTEFTDLFIALAREKGIWAREIQGYGFSSDPNLRPLSLISDTLHAWPEYYDENKKIWIPVDPTWENTSGIDYFSSFDLNHIAFVIHGKKSDYPLPAGMYKIEDSKDIEIKATYTKPAEKNNLKINISKLPKQLTEQEELKGKIFIQNQGNTYLWQIPIKLSGQKLTVSPSKIIVSVLVPGQKKEFDFTLKADKTNKITNSLLVVSVANKKNYRHSFKIYPYYYQLGIKITIGTLVLVLIFLIVRNLLMHLRV